MPDAPDLATPHGAADLPVVRVESHSLDIREEGGFLGDKASETAFRELLDLWRDRLAEAGSTPFGEGPTEEIEREELDEALVRPDDPDEAEALERALAAFSDDLADVLQRFLRTPSWAGVERIVCGGGLQSSQVGHEAVRRAQRRLSDAGADVALSSLHHDPDDGGMIGWAHAAPRSALAQGEAFLAVDIGGTNLRCGLVALGRGAAEPRVVHREKWCHAEDGPDREEVVDHMATLLRDAAEEAEARGLRLAPFIGLSCPGIVRADGSFASGVQNLPGDWTEDGFRLPDRIRLALPSIGGRPTVIRLHNDAVIQGLSEWPFMQGVERWAAVTIGTGLGNCAFRNREAGRND